MSRDIHTNPLVDLVEELGLDEPPVLLHGYPQVDGTRVRLFSDLSRSDHLEFDREDIVHVMDAEREEDPVTVMVSPDATISAVSRLDVTASEMKGPTPDPWRPDPDPYGEMGPTIPTPTPAAGPGPQFVEWSTQPQPSACRVTGPIYKWHWEWVRTPIGPYPVPKRVFVGFGLDCNY